jgi:hypothetical protein
VKSLNQLFCPLLHRFQERSARCLTHFIPRRPSQSGSRSSSFLPLIQSVLICGCGKRPSEHQKARTPGKCPVTLRAVKAPKRNRT